ncbi:MAG: DinB family protein [Chloroflexota bacterium]
MANRRPRMAQPITKRKGDAPPVESETRDATTPDAPEQATVQSRPESAAVEMLPSLTTSASSPGVNAEPAGLFAAPAPQAPPQAPQVPEAGSEAPQTLREIVARAEDGWRQFRAAAGAFPSERMDERLGDGWTRKQMLAHITAWHDMAHDRLGKMIMSGRPEPSVDDADAFNARIARQAIGRTAGEILKEMEMTFNRLRRQLGRLNEEQLVANDGWAATVIAANTYEHYEEHWADVYQPPQPDGRGSRR